MEKHSNLWLGGLLSAAFAMLALSCMSGDFAGTATKAPNFKGKPGSDDGEDGDGGSEGGKDGGKDGDGGTDEDGGLESGGFEAGDGTSESDGHDGSDGSGREPDPEDLATSDDEIKGKYMHDGTVHRSKSDESFTLKVETLIRGTVVQTNNFTFKRDGQAQEGETLKLGCRGSAGGDTQKNTCLRVTAVGDLTQIVGAAECAFVKADNGNAVDIHIDTNGSGLIGSCRVGDDELITITCPSSKDLKVENCNE